MTAPGDRGARWWQPGVLYQIYPRSYGDSNGDGIGDLQGVIDHLDHLEWLGVDGIWLSPTMPSPNADWGYDVADYCDVDPVYGSMEVLDRLIAEAGERGIRVLLDLVPNHTSSNHRWFVDAQSSRHSPYRDWYVWRDPLPDGSAPNNWVSSFGGPAWTLDDRTGQYYLHNFLPEQPDLDWWNDKVRDAFDDILRFWFDRGIAGFRIDVCTMIIKDVELRDNPPSGPDDPFVIQVFGQRPVYNANRPETHDVFRRWRRLAESYDQPRLLLGETSVEDLQVLITYYGDGTDELHLAFNFVFLEENFVAEDLRHVVEHTETLLPPAAWPVWVGSNHDISRLSSRWAEGDPARTRLALLMLLTLRGTAVLYQGDEIGLTDTVLEREDLRDPVGMRYWPYYPGRDPERTPMHWSGEPGGGFCPADVRPWLPLGDVAACNVEDQRGDPDSVLEFTRRVIALRRDSPDLRLGAYASLPSPTGVWAWRRGDGTTVALNFTDQEVTVEGLPGRVVLSTARPAREGEAGPTLVLGPAEGVVVERVGA
ncbi:MAG TPA: alpha-amylase family glycosyl hydrolase [Acidimicrobiales bacterium]|nr:alpha-amylase family glycosyl hydrolase [Acidimicrobiales bacterium]